MKYKKFLSIFAIAGVCLIPSLTIGLLSSTNQNILNNTIKTSSMTHTDSIPSTFNLENFQKNIQPRAHGNYWFPNSPTTFYTTDPWPTSKRQMYALSHTNNSNSNFIFDLNTDYQPYLDAARRNKHDTSSLEKLKNGVSISDIKRPSMENAPYGRGSDVRPSTLSYTNSRFLSLLTFNIMKKPTNSYGSAEENLFTNLRYALNATCFTNSPFNTPSGATSFFCVDPSKIKVDVEARTIQYTVAPIYGVYGDRGWYVTNSVAHDLGLITTSITIKNVNFIQQTKYLEKTQINIPNKNNTLTTSFSQQDAENWLSSSGIIDQLFSNVPSGARIFVKNFDNKTHINDGYITLDFDINKYNDANGDLITNTPSIAKFYRLRIDGFANVKNNPQMFSTSITSPIKISGFDQLLPQEYNSKWAQIQETIKNELVKPGNVSNLNPNGGKLSVNDITINFASYNNATGEITVDVIIGNNKTQVNGVPKQSSTFKGLVVSGFRKTMPTILKTSTISINQWNSIDWSSNYATDLNVDNILKFINEKKNEIFNFLPSNASLSVIGDPTYVNQDGKIIININVDKHYDSSSQLVDKPFVNNLSLTITGFATSNTFPEMFTTYLVDADLGLKNILPDEVESNQLYQDQIKQAIIDQGLIKNSIHGINITKNDIVLSKFNPINKDGKLTLNVALINGAQNAGKPNPQFNQNITLSGFNTQLPTNIAKEITLSGFNEITVSEVTQQQVQQYFDAHKYEIINNLPANANVNVTLDKNDLSLIKNGKIKVNVSVSPYYDANGNKINNNPLIASIVVGGFKKSSGITSSLKQSFINIRNGINNQLLIDKLPYDICNTNIEVSKIAIKQYLVDNQEIIFANLNGVLTTNDIQINSINNPINKSGSLNISFQINNKCLINNIPQSMSFNNVEVVGFATQQPTEWLNPNNIGFGLIGANNILVSDVNLTNLEEIINNVNYKNKNLIVSNAPINEPIKVKSIKGSNYKNGTIIAELTLANYFDQNGNPSTNPSFIQEYTFGGFKKITNTTCVNGPILLPNSNNIIASTEITNESKKTQLENQIRDQIINGNYLQNLNLPSGEKIPVDSVHVVIDPLSSDNLNGSLNVNVTVDSPYYMENGVSTAQKNPITVTINGFKKLQQTQITPDMITGGNNNQTVNDLITNVDKVKNNIVASLPENAFPNGKPNINDVNIAFNKPNSLDGSVDVTVTIPTDYVDASGNIIKGPFEQTITVTGLVSNTQNTIIENGILGGVADIIASDLNTISPDIEQRIKQAIIDSQIIKNSKPSLSVNDIAIRYIPNSANNLNGSAKFDITINNGFAIINGLSQQSYHFTNILITGFRKLAPTNINFDLLFNNKDKTIDDLLKNPQSAQIEVKGNIIAQLTPDMFPNGVVPSPEQIQVEFTNPDPQNGTVDVTVTIPGNYVDANGNIIQGPFSQTRKIGNFVKVNNSSWIDSYWWIILVCVSGGLLLILIILLILRNTKAKQFEMM